MQTLTLTLPRPHEGQQTIKRGASRFNVVPCGRRFGKTTLGIDLAIEKALTGPVGWFSPTYKDLLEVWRECKAILGPVVKRSSIQERRIETIGGVLEFWSMTDVDAGRGRKYARVIVDEAGLVPHLLDAWQQAIRPTLTDLRGDAFFFGTPKGRNGFWQLYQLGLDQQNDEWAAFQMPSAANPHIPADEIEAMRRGLPERTFAQEIMAHFLEDAGGVFRGVMAAATAQEQDRPVEGHDYAFGVDWAQQADFTVIAVIDMGTKELVYLDRFNQIDYSIQRGRLLALYEKFRPVTIYSELNSIGLPVTEQLQRQGLPLTPMTTTNATKAAWIDALALAFERGDIKILNDATLIGELQAFEMTKTQTGLRKFSAPEGMHDDTVMALALAWQSVAARRPALV